MNFYGVLVPAQQPIDFQQRKLTPCLLPVNLPLISYNKKQEK